jgi:preprotein translocase subunit YajC
LGGKAETQWRCSDIHVSDGDEVVTLGGISSKATKESDLLKKHHLDALDKLKVTFQKPAQPRNRSDTP